LRLVVCRGLFLGGGRAPTFPRCELADLSTGVSLPTFPPV